MNKRSRCGTTSLFVRSFHTTIVLGVPISLLFKNSALHASLMEGNRIYFGVLYLGVLGLSLAMYYATCFIDPGYIVIKHRKSKKAIPTSTSDDEEPYVNPDVDINVDGEGDDDAEKSEMLSSNKSGSRYRVCDYCEITQPMRSKHCEDCNLCVRKFDHHCPWLEACVGERNHRYFWLFLLSTALLIMVTLYITWESFEYEFWWSSWFKTNAVLVVDMIILVFSGLVVWGLLAFHSYLMFKGLTTWEAAARERITYLKYLDEDYNPFNEGLCRNLFYFMCACRLRTWEKVYHSRANQSNGIV